MIDRRVWSSALRRGALGAREIGAPEHRVLGVGSALAQRRHASARRRPGATVRVPKKPAMPHMSGGPRARCGTPLPCGRASGRGRNRARRALAPAARKARAQRGDRRAAGRAPAASASADARRDEEAGDAVVDRLADRADRRRHHRQPQAIACMIACGTPSSPYDGSVNEVERLQPRHDVVLLAGEADVVGEAERRELARRAGRGTGRRRRRSPASRATRRGRGRSPRTGSSWPFQSRSVATMPSAGRGRQPEPRARRRGVAGHGSARGRCRSGTDVMWSSGMPLSRASWRRSASPVVTMCAIAWTYSQRVPMRLCTVVDTCRVRTIGGACAQRRAGDRAEPAVGRAVRVEHVDARAVRREPAAQREEAPAAASSVIGSGTTARPIFAARRQRSALRAARSA